MALEISQTGCNAIKLVELTLLLYFYCNVHSLPNYLIDMLYCVYYIEKANMNYVEVKGIVKYLKAVVWLETRTHFYIKTSMFILRTMVAYIE